MKSDLNSNPVKRLLHNERRCRCGQLLALLSGDGIEIKCKRCKRLEVVGFEQLIDLLKSSRTKDPESRSIRPGKLSARASAGSCPCQVKEGMQ